jgi:hypothetical protein
MLYSKNGSIPKTETDGTEGWDEVPDAPDCPEGKEVIWWFPPGWVIRDPKPTGNWSWSQSQEQWIEIVQEVIQTDTLTTEQVEYLTSNQIQSLTTDQI